MIQGKKAQHAPHTLHLFKKYTYVYPQGRFKLRLSLSLGLRLSMRLGLKLGMRLRLRLGLRLGLSLRLRTAAAGR